MNRFTLNTLSNDELLLLLNVLNESLHAFDDEDQFHARIGVEIIKAQKLHQELYQEHERRVSASSLSSL